MSQTERTLLEQMRITEFEIANRKILLAITDSDARILRKCRPYIESEIDALVARFYELQTAIPEIALLIGDADTLGRLKAAQRQYILDLFSGVYDMEYVNNRLRIGLVHKRIGVEPKLYLSAVGTLKTLLNEQLDKSFTQETDLKRALEALERLFLFDVTLIFETYIRSLVAEIESSKERSERYAVILEEKVKERTAQLEELSRVDALTGLLNVRDLFTSLTKTLRGSKRHGLPVSVVYLDIDNFKTINDTLGHQRGDDVLRAVGTAILRVSRAEDSCFRYGGDEMCIILPDCTKEQAREIYGARLEAALNQEMESQGLSPVEVSFGVIQAGPEEYPEAEELVRAADREMYLDKQSKREPVAN